VKIGRETILAILQAILFMPLIDAEPSDWRDLEEKVARVLRECGMDAASPHPVVLARGEVDHQDLRRPDN
jgi:hypothetical protein